MISPTMTAFVPACQASRRITLASDIIKSLVMPSIALQDKLATAGAQMGEYRGASTVAHFGDVSREFAALRSGFAVFDMSWRSKLLITGDDRLRWLNGMITNNVRDLAVGSGVYAFLLS